MSTFDGQRLKSARKRRRLSRQQLGDALGLDSRRISQWELGKRAPEQYRVSALADLLMIEPDELLRRDRHDVRQDTDSGRAAARRHAR